MAVQSQKALQARILRFWFKSPPPIRDALWWSGSTEVDERIRGLFGNHVEAALREEYDSWADTGTGALCLIVMLDQFTRNLYRGTANAFAGDAKALAITLAGLEQGYFSELGELETVFFLMPLEHSENLRHQDRCIEEMNALLARAAPEYQKTIQDNLDFAYQHQAIIAKFGRFPYRNAVLGRMSSMAEQKYLAKGGRRFGQ